MRNSIASFFREKFRIMPTQDDMRLVQNIVNELQKIEVPGTGDFSFSRAQQKFVRALVQCFIDAYTQYRFVECASPIYRAVRDSRAEWKHAKLENGPKAALERISRQYWLEIGQVGRLDADAHGRVLNEFTNQILEPLGKAMDKGMVKGSRLDYLLSYLKSGIRNGVVYPTLVLADEAIKEAERAAADEAWCRAAGYQ